jgi:hypothetical protein
LLQHLQRHQGDPRQDRTPLQGGALVKVIETTVLIDEGTYDKLMPLITDMAQRLQNSASDHLRVEMMLNGWTYVSLAWGLALRGFTTIDGELEIVIADGNDNTTHTLMEEP